MHSPCHGIFFSSPAGASRCKTGIAARRFVQAGITFLAVVGTISGRTASAQNMYVAGTGDQFGILNAATGAYTNIGFTSSELTGLGYGSDGNLYGLQLATNAPTLYRINTQTAALTAVGNIAAFNASGSAYGIGMSSTSDGTLYAVYGGGSTHSNDTQSLYTLNINTAAATLVGSVGQGGDGNLGGDSNGNLFFVQGDGGTQFDKVSRTTGAATVLNNAAGFGSVYAIAASGATFYAFGSTGQIYTMNTTTGSATAGATYNTANVGTVYGAVAVRGAAAPEPGCIALLVLAGLPAAGMVVRRRRTAA